MLCDGFDARSLVDMFLANNGLPACRARSPLELVGCYIRTLALRDVNPAVTIGCSKPDAVVTITLSKHGERYKMIVDLTSGDTSALGFHGLCGPLGVCVDTGTADDILAKIIAMIRRAWEKCSQSPFVGILPSDANYPHLVVTEYNGLVIVDIGLDYRVLTDDKLENILLVTSADSPMLIV